MLLQGVSDPRWEWTACQEKQCPPRGRDRVMDDQDGGGRQGQTVGELPHPCLSGRAVGGEATGHAEGLALGRSKKTEGHQKCSRLLTQSRRVGMGTPSGGEGSKWSGAWWPLGRGWVHEAQVGSNSMARDPQSSCGVWAACAHQPDSPSFPACSPAHSGPSLASTVPTLGPSLASACTLASTHCGSRRPPGLDCSLPLYRLMYLISRRRQDLQSSPPPHSPGAATHPAP